MKETNSHIYFWGSNLSQWSPCSFTDGTNTFKTAEQYMMWSKAILFKDQDTADKILQATDPKIQKNLGREVKGI